VSEPAPLRPRLSAVVSARNEEHQLAACLEGLRFADEIVVVLDRCTDGSKDIARRYTDRIIEGAWEREGDRRNAAIAACRGEWIFEIDADERVPPGLAQEIRRVVNTSPYDWHEILVDNYIGGRLVRWGWGASYGKAAYPGLFRKGVKTWGRQRVHPSLTWGGRKGPMLETRIEHFVDRNISDMIRRLDSYSTARAKDLRETGDIGSLPNNVRRLVTRFFKCYVLRQGYREGGYGLLIALFAGLYPLLSHLKARLEKDE
jgi:glycosyltransferase involved in cell wall biosynthesis